MFIDRQIRERLIKAAREKSTVTYSLLNDELELGFDFRIADDRVDIGLDIEDVSSFEHEKGRPLLSALVVSSGAKKTQGSGFNKLCEKLDGVDWKSKKKNRGYEKECYAFWGDNDNYKKFRDDDTSAD